MIKLSPREQSLLDNLSSSEWVTSRWLTMSVFGQPKSWPLHARTMITGAMASINRKLHRNGGKIELIKRGGGRGGMEYRLRMRKRRAA